MISSTGVSGRIIAKTYRLADLPIGHSRWRLLSRKRQLWYLRHQEPEEIAIAENIACIGGHERIVQGLNGAAPTALPARFIAVGKGSTDPAESDRSLDDRVEAGEVVETSDNGSSASISTVFDEAQANVDTGAGEALTECGVIAGGMDGEPEILLNRSLFNQDIDKNDSLIATITARLIYEAI